MARSTGPSCRATTSPANVSRADVLSRLLSTRRAALFLTLVAIAATAGCFSRTGRDDGAIRITGSDTMVGLAQAYCRFAITHTNRWTALFEHGERINRNIPDWHLEEHVQLISHVVKSLERLYPDRKPAEQWQLAGLLFSAVHGVVSLGLQGFFFAVPPDQLEQQVTSLVQAALAGLPGSHPRQ